MKNVSAWWAIILIALLVSAASVAAEGSKGNLCVGGFGSMAQSDGSVDSLSN